MSGEKSATPPTQRSPNPHPEEEGKEEGLGGEERLSATPKSVSEPPEGWEPLPLDTNYKNPAYRTYRYRGVTLLWLHLEVDCMDHWARYRGRPTDVIVASSPKSGTTWLQELVWRVVNAETGPESGAGVPIEYRCPLLDLPSVGDKMVMAPLDETPDPRLIKTHLPYHLLPGSVLTSGARLLYISRDPRDVCVSLYHFCRLLDSHTYRGTFAEFRESFLRGKPFYGPYRAHVRGYQQHSDTVLHVTYEQLHQERAAVVRRVAAFLDRPLTADQAEAIVRYTSFQAMKRNPTTNFRHWERVGMITEGEGTFMRKGEVGDWRNYFTQEESDAFMNALM